MSEEETDARSPARSLHQLIKDAKATAKDGGIQTGRWRVIREGERVDTSTSPSDIC